VRAWRADDSADLAATMTATDKALDRAGELARSLGDGPEALPEDAAEPKFEGGALSPTDDPSI
jgi:hypothetical protein